MSDDTESMATPETPKTYRKENGANSALELDAEERQRIICFGYNQYEQTTVRNPNKKDHLTINYPHTIDVENDYKDRFRSQIIAIATGLFHTLILEEYGNVTAWGHNENHQLGVDNSGENVPFPEGERIVQVVAGNEHSLFLSDTGIVYATGDNTESQLGINMPYLATPVPVPPFQRDEETDRVKLHVTHIAAGQYTSFAVVDERQLYAWGNNDEGQLGMSADLATSAPTMVFEVPDEETTIKKVACGEYHTILLTSDGSVYVSGNNDYGAIGIPSTDQFTKIKVNNNDKNAVVVFSDIACGASHTLLLGVDGVAWVMGKNNLGVLGLGHEQNVNVPVQLTSNVKSVHAGAMFSMIVTNDNQLYGAGRNKDGELGTEAFEKSNKLVNIPIPYKIRSISCGGYHSLILSGPKLRKNTIISYKRHVEIVAKVRREGAQMRANIGPTNYAASNYAPMVGGGGKIGPDSISDFDISELPQGVRNTYEENDKRIQALYQQFEKEKRELKANYEERIQNAIGTIDKVESLQEQKGALELQLKEEQEKRLKLQQEVNHQNTQIEKLQRVRADQPIDGVSAARMKEKYEKQVEKLSKLVEDDYVRNILWLVTLRSQYVIREQELDAHHSRARRAYDKQIDEILTTMHSTQQETNERIAQQYEQRIAKLQYKIKQLGGEIDEDNTKFATSLSPTQFSSPIKSFSNLNRSVDAPNTPIANTPRKNTRPLKLSIQNGKQTVKCVAHVSSFNELLKVVLTQCGIPSDSTHHYRIDTFSNKTYKPLKKVYSTLEKAPDSLKIKLVALHQ